MNEISANCKWCADVATDTDYREVDGITSKIPTCEVCKELDTDYLLSRPEPIFTKTDNLVNVKLMIQGEMFDCTFEEEDEWYGDNGWDIHYCEDYKHICVYKITNGNTDTSVTIEKYAIPEEIIIKR